MKKRHVWQAALGVAIVLCLSGGKLLAQDVTAAWSSDVSGNWSEGNNWSGDEAATGTNGVAYFTNAITANCTVTVDSTPWTIGTVVFANNGAYGFTIARGTLNALTNITVNSNSTATVLSVIEGTAGLTTSGGGTLILAATNIYTGNTIISNGTLVISSGGILEDSDVVDPISGGAMTIDGTVDITNGVLATGTGTSGMGTMNIEPGAVVNVVNGPNGTAGTACRTYVGGLLDATGSYGLGILNINGGTLNLDAGGSGAAGDASHLWLNPWGSGGASTLNFNGGVLSTARPIADGGSGVSVITFNGGTLQAAANFATNISMDLIQLTAPNTEMVRNGGAVIDTQGNSLAINTVLSHSTMAGDNAIDGGLTKLGSGTLTLSGANTYTGRTTISNGTLALSSSGSLGASSSVSIAAGATFDVSAYQFTYTWGASAGLTASGSATPAILNGGSNTVNLNSRPATLNFTPASFSGDASHPALSVSAGALNLGTSTVTVNNNAGTALGGGAYTLIAGTVSGTPTLDTTSGVGFGTGRAAGTVAGLTNISGNLVVVVTSTGLPGTTTTIALQSPWTSSSTYGDALQFNVKVSNSGGPAPTGVVTVKSDGFSGVTLGTGTLSGGSVTVALNPLNALAAGTYPDIAAIYPGDSNNSPSAGALAAAQVVAPKPLTVTGASAQSKIYDGTTAATVTGTLNTAGVLSGDTVSLGAGVFANAGPGTGIAVTFDLVGASAANYTVTPPGITADILPAGIWTGAAGNTLWGTTNNWVGNLVPAGTVTATFTTLSFTTNQTVNLNSPVTIENLIFGDTDTNSTAGWTLANDGVPANTLTLVGASPTVTANGLGDTTISAVVAGTAGLAVNGTGTLVLAATNLYTGSTYVTAGTLLIPSGGILNDSDLVDPISGGAMTISGAVNITNGVFATGTGTAGTGTLNIEPGAVVNVVNGANASRVYIGGELDGHGQAGLGILNMEGGILNIPAGGIGAAGDASGFWLNPWANGGASTVNLDGGLVATARPIQDGGSGTSVVNLNGATLQATASTVLLGNAGNYLLTTFNVRDGGAVIDTQGYSAIIGSPLIHSTNAVDNPIDGGLTKIGSGTLTLLGACTYSGTTTISNGTLVLNGSLNGGGAVNVIAPAALACSGAINGSVALTAGSASLLLTNSLGNTVSLGTGLTLSNGNVLTFAEGTAQNQLAVDYAPFTQEGTATIYITPLDGFTVGTYDLITYAQGISKTHFTLGNTIPGYTMSLTDPDSATLALVVQSTAPLAAFWHNRSGTLWTVATNWDTDASSDVAVSTPPGPPTAVTFAANDATVFNTTLGANFSISSLTFSTPSNVAIGGANTLTLDGDLTVSTGAGSNTISDSAVILGVNQTWTVTDPGNTLWVSSAVSGASSLTVTGAGTVALAGTNTYTGSTIVNGATLNVAPGAALNGTASVDSVNGGALTISGPLSTTNGFFAIGTGTSGTGTINIEPGAVVNVVNGTYACRTYIGGKLDGTGSTGIGILNMEGGILNIPAPGAGAAGDASGFWLNPYGSAGASTLNLDGGVLATKRPIQDGGSGTSVLNLNGGTLQAATNTVLFGNAGNYLLGTFNVRNGGAVIDTHGFNATIGSPQNHSSISGDDATDGGLTKIGAGALTLLGASTYNGGTTISAGTLLVNNTAGSGTGSGPVTVLSNATLAGSGVLSGWVTVLSGGTLAPGASSIGKLTINSNLTLAGNLFIEISKSVSPSNSQVVVSDTLTNAGTGTVTVTNLGPTALAAGNRFQLFSEPLLNGQALAITPAPGSGLAWSNNLAVDGSIAVVVSTVVPPPVFSGIAKLSSTSFSLTFSGENGQGYTVLMTTNLTTPLANWTHLTNGTFSASAVDFTDTGATNAERFYRIVSP